MFSGDEFYSDDITSPLERPMRQPRYQYCLYGPLGEFMGITAHLKTAKAHKAKCNVYYFRRYEYDAEDRNWSAARERGLVCE